MDLRSPLHPHDASRTETTAPWPPLPPEDPSSFRWLQPGELLAIPVPTTALQLDALLRHLEIDAEFSDWPSATIHLAQARSTWGRLEPALSTRPGRRSEVRDARKAAVELAKHLDRAARAVASAQRDLVMRHARAALSQIEAIQRAFE